MLLTLALSRPHTTTPEMLEQAMQCPNDPVFGLKWYIVPLFVIWLFLIVNEIRQKRFSVVFGAAAFWLWDVFNETWNAMVYATTGQPVWGTTAAGGSALQILVGYNIEISFMFFILGMLTCKLLKTSEGYEGQGFFDANKNWLDDPNNMYYKANKKKSELTPEEYKTKVKAILGRIGVIVFGSIAAVIIEILLNKCNVLTWEKPWWQPNFPFILFLIGYVPFYVAAVVIHDLPRKWQLIGLGAILFVVVLLLIISGSLGMLGHQTDGHGNWIGKFCDGDNGIIRAILRV
ncbi:MAG: hypothetical protein MR643_04870 [Clostridiales bacterium]|jgi:uncharacterized protein AF_2236|nr:hypothetical protein [Clostridium sp.]MCI6183610.1 hypothetical protein [Clostridiales bacterium]MCI7201412.1 hypothetical protein [Clostridiales bacterium]MDY5689986.1 hypothetical protein [Eubacteriales bacterium]MDY5933529.1 hypothetical protein [Eubacteriales bacterium]